MTSREGLTSKLSQSQCLVTGPGVDTAAHYNELIHCQVSVASQSRLISDIVAG
jgi:hypothetical protein